MLIQNFIPLIAKPEVQKNQSKAPRTVHFLPPSFTHLTNIEHLPCTKFILTSGKTVGNKVNVVLALPELQSIREGRQLTNNYKKV